MCNTYLIEALLYEITFHLFLHKIDVHNQNLDQKTFKLFIYHLQLILTTSIGNMKECMKVNTQYIFLRILYSLENKKEMVF